MRKTHEPIDILPNRRKETIKDYLMKYGADVEIVVMDMNPSFKAAVRKALIVRLSLRIVSFIAVEFNWH